MRQLLGLHENPEPGSGSYSCWGADLCVHETSPPQEVNWTSQTSNGPILVEALADLGRGYLRRNGVPAANLFSTRATGVPVQYLQSDWMMEVTLHEQRSLVHRPELEPTPSNTTTALSMCKTHARCSRAHVLRAPLPQTPSLSWLLRHSSSTMASLRATADGRVHTHTRNPVRGCLCIHQHQEHQTQGFLF